jgi:leader peptidase (prepilin peptidase)/N-methyltransferase
MRWEVLLFFLVGTCVGSFLNVCIYRLPRGISIVRPGSHCPQCGTPINWYDNIPIFSFLALGGKCRRCKGEISQRYMLVEGLTGILFALVAYKFRVLGEYSYALVGAYLLLIGALMVSTFTDIELQIIPDAVTISGMAMAPLLSLLVPELHAKFSLLGRERIDSLIACGIGMGVGAGMLYVVGRLGKLVLQQEAMGGGDVKLMGMVGGFIGWQGTVMTFFLGAIIAAVVGVALLVRRRQRVIPFGPFLSVAAVAVMFYGDDIWSFLTALYTGGM